MTEVYIFYLKPDNNTLNSCLFYLSDNLNYDTSSSGYNDFVSNCVTFYYPFIFVNCLILLTAKVNV